MSDLLMTFMLGGADWVLWLLCGLSIVSIAFMFERGVAFSASRIPDHLLSELGDLLAQGNHAAAIERLNGRRGIEAQVALEGLARVPRGAAAVAEAMAAARCRERGSLERYLSYFGTLGSNAPFIGLFGTVLGIIRAFHDLSKNQDGGTSAVMSGISEALVATAIGLLVAIPAVVAYNIFQRWLRRRIARADELAHSILASLDPAGGSTEGELLAAGHGHAATRSA